MTVFLWYVRMVNFLAVCRTFIHFCTYVFSVNKMPLFGLQACVGNYQKITNTNAAANNNPPIYKNKGRHYFYNAIKITVYSVRDKYNEVT